MVLGCELYTVSLVQLEVLGLFVNSVQMLTSIRSITWLLLPGSPHAGCIPNTTAAINAPQKNNWIFWKKCCLHPYNIPCNAASAIDRVVILAQPVLQYTKVITYLQPAAFLALSAPFVHTYHLR
jgi:hypothetical protein